MKTENATTSTGAYRYYVLLILMAGYALSVIDRGLISVALTDIKTEFEFTDTQLGLLSGLAFALVYSCLSIPIAWWADRTNRRNIVAGAITFWSLATALCGAAIGFWTLFLARVGVGVGEAGGNPPSHSMLSDYFEPSELGRALGIFSIGAVIGGLAGHLFGSYMVETYNWRIMFMAAGIPGIVFGALVLLTIKEPARRKTERSHEAPGEMSAPSSIRGTVGSLLSNRTYVFAISANALAWIPTMALFIWIYPVAERNFELSKIAIGSATATAMTIGAIPGMYLGGFLSDILVKRNEKWRGWAPAIFAVLAAPVFLLMLTRSDFQTTMICFGLYLFLFNLTQGPVLSTIQLVVKPHERALAAAVGLFAANMLGQTLAPVLVGALSDGTFASFGVQSLNYSLAVLGAALIPAGILYLCLAASVSKSQ